MALLNKEQTLFARDERGELLPIEVTLELLEDKPTVMVIPVPRGKLARLLAEAKAGVTDEDTDVQVIADHCAAPSYTVQEAQALKPTFANAIATAIYSASLGKPQVSDGKNDFLEEQQATKRSDDS